MLFDEKAQNIIQRAQLLVVGAGGIGCELLKSLVLSGFRCIHVIDLDTIAVSNLNRQFLFRKEDVGKPKSQVAVERLRSAYPMTKLEWECEDIKSKKFNTEFYTKFDIILNALDNLEARKHVNRMCIASKRPLIESGTNGYNGNVTPIICGKTPCYECNPKIEGKTYPICTIRSTPTKIVHCVVWAKALHDLLFGPEDDYNYLSDLRVLAKPSTTSSFWLNKLFVDDIIEMKKCKEMPIQEIDISCESIKEFIKEFEQSYSILLNSGCHQFDKDNDTAVNFVWAAANLRAKNFGIPGESLFKIKQIAGNIIAAISSSNAAVGALQVLEAVKILGIRQGGMRNVFVSNKQSRHINSAVVETPNPECVVCGHERKVLQLYANLDKLSLQIFIDQFIKREFNMHEPSISTEATILYESGEGLEESELLQYSKNAGKTFKELGIVSKDVLLIEDYIQNVKIRVEVNEKVLDTEKYQYYFSFEGSAEIFKETESVAKRPLEPEIKEEVFQSKRMKVDEEDDLQIIDQDFFTEPIIFYL